MGWFNHQLAIHGSYGIVYQTSVKSHLDPRVLYRCRRLGDLVKDLRWEEFVIVSSEIAGLMIRAYENHCLDVFLLGDFLKDSIPWDSSPLFTIMWEKMFGTFAQSTLPNLED